MRQKSVLYRQQGKSLCQTVLNNTLGAFCNSERRIRLNYHLILKVYQLHHLIFPLHFGKHSKQPKFDLLQN